jgi:hypothetical protein
MRYLIIPVLLFLLLSCKEESRISEISEAEEAKIREIGQKAAAQLLKSLQTKLKTTIANQGMMRAINVCNFEALNLTDSIQHTMNDVIEIKRTSLRFRNPKNAPDPLEREALTVISSIFQRTGNIPEDYIEKVNNDSLAYFRYYKPLTIKALCLNCHGPSDQIDNNVKYQLRKLYPQDHAIGYKLNQLRGLVRISIK